MNSPIPGRGCIGDFPGDGIVVSAPPPPIVETLLRLFCFSSFSSFFMLSLKPWPFVQSSFDIMQIISTTSTAGHAYVLHASTTTSIYECPGVLFSKTIRALYFVCNNIPFIVRVFGVHACPVNFWGIGNPLKHEAASSTCHVCT